MGLSGHWLVDMISRTFNDDGTKKSNIIIPEATSLVYLNKVDESNMDRFLAKVEKALCIGPEKSKAPFIPESNKSFPYDKSSSKKTMFADDTSFATNLLNSRDLAEIVKETAILFLDDINSTLNKVRDLPIEVIKNTLITQAKLFIKEIDKAVPKPMINEIYSLKGYANSSPTDKNSDIKITSCLDIDYAMKYPSSTGKSEIKNTRLMSTKPATLTTQKREFSTMNSPKDINTKLLSKCVIDEVEFNVNALKEFLNKEQTLHKNSCGFDKTVFDDLERNLRDVKQQLIQGRGATVPVKISYKEGKIIN